eukprot:Platyproteum_vivax@DN8849_c0_g1_i1.p1
MAQNYILFKDQFTVRRVDKERFEKVARLECQDVSMSKLLAVDVNCQLFQVEPNDKLEVVIASSLSPDEIEEAGWDQVTHSEKSYPLLNRYEYCMHGKVFREQESAGGSITVYASFGGLLMSLQGEKADLSRIAKDIRVYLLLK